MVIFPSDEIEVKQGKASQHQNFRDILGTLDSIEKKWKPVFSKNSKESREFKKSKEFAPSEEIV